MDMLAIWRWRLWRRGRRLGRSVRTPLLLPPTLLLLLLLLPLPGQSVVLDGASADEPVRVRVRVRVRVQVRVRAGVEVQLIFIVIIDEQAVDGPALR